MRTNTKKWIKNMESAFSELSKSIENANKARHEEKVNYLKSILDSLAHNSDALKKMGFNNQQYKIDEVIGSLCRQHNLPELRDYKNNGKID